MAWIGEDRGSLAVPWKSSEVGVYLQETGRGDDRKKRARGKSKVGKVVWGPWHPGCSWGRTLGQQCLQNVKLLRGMPPPVKRVRVLPSGPLGHTAMLQLQGPPLRHSTDTSADTLGESVPLPLWGEAKGGSRKGKLINSFHLQHFPHSIIFKLNKLSLGEKEKFPLSSALAGLTKPTLWGADGE